MAKQLRPGIGAVVSTIAGLFGALVIARPLRLGVHGIMNAGKTAFQTVLFMKKVFDRGRLSYHDPRTIELLRQNEAFLKANGKTPSTPPGNPDPLLYDLILADKTYAIEAREYSGALVDAATPIEFEHVVQEVLAFNVRSDGLLLLVDSSDRDGRQLDALNVLLKRLTSARSPFGNPRRPLAIVWTKVDRLTPLDADPATVERRVREKLRDHEVFRTVDQLRGDRNGPFILESFFVSVYGHELPKGRAVEREDITPFNIHAPVLWLADRGTKVVAARRQKRTRVTAAVLLACAALCVGLRETGCRYAAAEYDNVVAHRRAHAEESEAEGRLALEQRLRDSVWVRWSLLSEDDRRQLGQFIEEDRVADEHYQFATIVQRRAELEGEERAAARLTLVAATRYPDGLYQRQYAAFVKEDTEIDYWYRERNERAAIVATARKVPAGGGHALYERCRRFDQAFPRNKGGDEVRAAREAACRQWRDDLFASARQAETASPQDFENNRRLYRACQEVPGVANDTEVLEAVARIDDREQYHVLREKLASARDWDALAQARGLAEAYVNAGRKAKKMLGAVKEFQGWIDDVVGGRVTCSFEMVPVRFLYASDLWRVGDGDLCDVSVTLNGKTATARYNYDKQTSRFDVNGSLPIRWGDNPYVTLELRNAAYPANTAVGKATIAELFSGGGQVVVSMTEPGSRQQYNVTLWWKCGNIDAFRRRLPHYGD